MAIPLIASPAALPKMTELLTGDSSNFTATVGAWTNSGGTQTFDGTRYMQTGAPSTGSLKLACTTSGHYTNVDIPGTFKAGVDYWATVFVNNDYTVGSAGANLVFGLNGTDTATNGIALNASPGFGHGTAEFVGHTVRWRPTADRTGVTLRLTNSLVGTVAWYIGFASVRRAPSLYEIPLFGMGDQVVVPIMGNSAQVVGGPWQSPANNYGGARATSNGRYGIGNQASTAGNDIGTDAFFYSFAEHTPGDEANLGYGSDVGDDYVGHYFSELDSTHEQWYPYNDQYVQLKDPLLGGGWSHRRATDPTTLDAKVEDSFQWDFTLAGAQTTGTDKLRYFQVPTKCIIDEVRIRLATISTLANFIVDVNDDGTTIFTTQANRPHIGLKVKNITSGGDSTDAAGYLTASVTVKAGRLYLMSFENSHASAAAAAVQVTFSNGNGAAFDMTSRSSTTFNGGLNRVSIWSEVSSIDYTGTMLISFGGAQTGLVWSFDEVTGVDTASNDGVVQQAVGTGNSTTPLATLAAFGSAANGAYAAHGQAAAAATTPGTGWTELADATAATPAQALETAFRMDNDTTADATITSAQWGSCAIELLASNSATSLAPDGGVAVAKDSVLTFDIDQIGSGVAGSDLTVFVRGRQIW